MMQPFMMRKSYHEQSKRRLFQNFKKLLSQYFPLDLEDEHLWPHVEFRTLGGVRKHVDYLLAVNALMIKICHDLSSSVVICHDLS